jgi:hypothetical protein
MLSVTFFFNFLDEYTDCLLAVWIYDLRLVWVWIYGINFQQDQDGYRYISRVLLFVL